MNRLPFSPLTLGALNQRYDDALQDIGLRVAVSVARNEPVVDVGLLVRASEANEYYAATVQRIDVLRELLGEVA